MGRRCLEESDFCGPTTGKSRENLTTCKVPLGELLRGDSVGIFASIEPLEEGRAREIAAAQVEGEAGESRPLVGVEFDLDVGSKARGVVGDVLLEESDTIRLGEGELEGNLTAALGLAEMAVADSGVADGVLVDSRDEAFKVLDELKASSVDAFAVGGSSHCWRG